MLSFVKNWNLLYTNDLKFKYLMTIGTLWNTVWVFLSRGSSSVCRSRSGRWSQKWVRRRWNRSGLFARWSHCIWRSWWPSGFRSSTCPYFGISCALTAYGRCARLLAARKASGTLFRRWISSSNRSGINTGCLLTFLCALCKD